MFISYIRTKLKNLKKKLKKFLFFFNYIKKTIKDRIFSKELFIQYKITYLKEKTKKELFNNGNSNFQRAVKKTRIV